MVEIVQCDRCGASVVHQDEKACPVCGFDRTNPGWLRELLLAGVLITIGAVMFVSSVGLAMYSLSRIDRGFILFLCLFLNFAALFTSGAFVGAGLAVPFRRTGIGAMMGPILLAILLLAFIAHF